MLNSYCWMYSTFNIPPNFKGSCAKREHDGATLYNTYYQWVSIFLVIQVYIKTLVYTPLSKYAGYAILSTKNDMAEYGGRSHEVPGKKCKGEDN